MLLPFTAAADTRVFYCLVGFRSVESPPVIYLPDFANLNAQSTPHGAHPGPKLAPRCTGGPPACRPAAESARNDPRAPEKSVQIKKKKKKRTHIYTWYFAIISNTCFQPRHNAVNPLAVLSLVRPRLILPLVHRSPIAGIRGAAAGISPPRRRPPCTSMMLRCMIGRDRSDGFQARSDSSILLQNSVLV